MANREQLSILKSGVTRWNAWRLENFEAPIDLRDADLRGIDFSQSILSGADLRDADLQQARLSQADLRFADLSRTNLADADLSHARVGWTTFGNVDLSKALGLETVRHFGPSTIGVDTLYSSEGRIPKAFLNRAGVPETLIPHIETLGIDCLHWEAPDNESLHPAVSAGSHWSRSSVHFYSCFISHATADTAFADKLYADLQAHQIRCWYAPADLQGGQKLYEQLCSAIGVYDKLLLILSESSINSQWVQTEIWEARQQELSSGHRKLFPIGLINFDTLRAWRCFDGDTGRDMAREIREYYIPDFSNWREPDAYQQAFQKLVADLVQSGVNPSKRIGLEY